MDLLSKIIEFDSIVKDIKPAKDSSDQEIKENMTNITSWELKMKTINTSKINLDKSVIDLDTEPSDYDSVRIRYNNLIALFREKVKSIQDADKAQALYSLNKPVKETAVYPAAFSGRSGENISNSKKNS